MSLETGLSCDWIFALYSLPVDTDPHIHHIYRGGMGNHLYSIMWWEFPGIILIKYQFVIEGSKCFMWRRVEGCQLDYETKENRLQVQICFPSLCILGQC